MYGLQVLGKAVWGHRAGHTPDCGWSRASWRRGHWGWVPRMRRFGEREVGVESRCSRQREQPKETRDREDGCVWSPGNSLCWLWRGRKYLVHIMQGLECRVRQCVVKWEGNREGPRSV